MVKTYRRRTPEIPHEILSFHILPKLPAKSVVRFTSVSKIWHSLLTSEIFKKAHLQHITNNDDYLNPNKFLLVSTTTSSCEFRTIDFETTTPPKDGCLTSGRPLPFQPPHAIIKILASFHGLVCVGRLFISGTSFYSDLFLWNPLTSEYKTLSRANSHKYCYAIRGTAFGLYYSSCDDDYKLLCVIRDRRYVYITPDYRYFYIYSLKNDSWRKVESRNNLTKIVPYLTSESWRLSTWLNESLYFLKQGIKRGVWSYSIIRFDTKTEKFTEIPTPSIGFYRESVYFLSVERGNLHLCANCLKRTRTCIKLWSLNGDEDNWTKVETYLLHDRISFMKLLWRNKNWLMINDTRNGGFIYRVDLEKTNRKGEREDGTSLYTLVSTGIPEEVRYIETFVSPNQYMNK